MIDLYMTERVKWLRFSDRDQWSEPEPKQARWINAMVKRRSENQFDAQGMMRRSRITIRIKEQPDERDQFEVDGQTRSIMDVEQKRDVFSGQSFWKVRLA